MHYMFERELRMEEANVLLPVILSHLTFQLFNPDLILSMRNIEKSNYIPKELLMLISKKFVRMFLIYGWQFFETIILTCFC